MADWDSDPWAEEELTKPGGEGSVKDRAPRRRGWPGAVFWIGWLAGTAITTFIAFVVAALQVANCRRGGSGNETDTCGLSYLWVPLVFIVAFAICGVVAYAIDRNVRARDRP